MTPSTRLNDTIKLEPVPQQLILPVLLRAGDDVAASDIVSHTIDFDAETLSDPYEISTQAFAKIDAGYVQRTKDLRNDAGHCLIAGRNFGKGPASELSALAPRLLGLRVTIAKSYSNTFRTFLINCGIPPLVLRDEFDYDTFQMGDQAEFRNLLNSIRWRRPIQVFNHTSGSIIEVQCSLNDEELTVLEEGGSSSSSGRQAS